MYLLRSYLNLPTYGVHLCYLSYASYGMQLHTTPAVVEWLARISTLGRRYLSLRACGEHLVLSANGPTIEGPLPPLPPYVNSTALPSAPWNGAVKHLRGRSATVTGMSLTYEYLILVLFLTSSVVQLIGAQLGQKSESEIRRKNRDVLSYHHY